MLAMPWIATGVFVYQSYITESKEWGEFVIAQSFMAYSILGQGRPDPPQSRIAVPVSLLGSRSRFIKK